MAKLTPLPGESAADYLKRQAVEDCAVNYLAATGDTMLTQTLSLARADGVAAVFDLDVEHANAVFAALAGKTGKPAGVFIAQDLLARELIESQTGTDPGSPVPASMLLVPSDVTGYIAALAKLKEGFAALASLGYTVAPAS